MANAGSPIQPRLEPGARVDRYELLCHIARGGMADVWLARLHSKPAFEKLFALKTIVPSEADNAQFREMFLDEARLVSRIDHPNVVRVSDVGEHAAAPYFVMEFIDGESLDKLVRELAEAGRVVPVGIALRIAADVCSALAAAHELRDASGASLGVVHRDVSPQNILVTTNGLAKVIDFGIAKGQDRTARKTAVGLLKGKISYMPPEQAMGLEVDARADTWALGAVLYFMFVGRPPHKEESELATLRLAMTGAPIAPLPSTVPAPVRALVDKALRANIDERFQSAAEMAAALERVMRHTGIAASSSQVAAFLRDTMGARLTARREIVARFVAEAVERESCRIEAAIPVDVEIDAAAAADPGAESDAEEAEPPRGSGSWRAAWSRSAARSILPPPRRRGRSVPALLAIGCSLVAGLVVGLVVIDAPRGPATIATPSTRASAGARQLVTRAATAKAPTPMSTSTPKTATTTTPAPASGAAPAPSAPMTRPMLTATIHASASAVRPHSNNPDDEAGF